MLAVVAGIEAIRRIEMCDGKRQQAFRDALGHLGGLHAHGVFTLFGSPTAGAPRSRAPCNLSNRGPFRRP
jgi:hypothetical protein